jgi:N-acylglucosamine 2-epimerase
MALELDEDNTLKRCLQKVGQHFEPSKRLLMENASPDPDFRRYPEGRLVCVGSIFEIVWILLRALDRHPDPELERRLLDCADGAMEFGWDQRHGGLYYFQDVEGRSQLALESNMKLWWTHAEALYCLLACYERTGDPKWLTHLQKVVEWTFSHFPDREHGEWFGYLDRHGDVALPLKGGSYKGCFHIPRALLFSLQALERLRAKPGR